MSVDEVIDGCALCVAYAAGLPEERGALHTHSVPPAGERRRRQLRRQAYRAQSGLCVWCGAMARRGVAPNTPDAPTLERLVPRVLGGPNAPWNVAMAHQRCNHERAAEITKAAWRIVRARLAADDLARLNVDLSAARKRVIRDHQQPWRVL